MGGICCGPSKKPVTPPVTPPLPSQTSIRPSTVKDVKPRTPSPSTSQESSSDPPFSKTGMSKSNPLNLIQGYENEPLVSLEEALGPFYGKIIDLSDYIKEAKTKCYYPEKPKLTLDESAAIYIYTMKWGDGCLYNRLQDAWKSNDPLELKPWLKYLKLFKNAFDKLPDANEEIWQGKLFDDKFEEEITLNSSSLYMVMDIFSPSKTVVEETLDSENVEKKILIGFKSVGGKLLGEYSAMNLNKVLVFPGTKVGVSEVMSDNFSVIYHVTGPSRKYHCCCIVSLCYHIHYRHFIYI
jgi:hypothetical protein